MDDFSRFPWIYFLKKKSEVLVTYNQWKTDVQAFFKQEIETEEFSENYTEFLCSDGGGEYIGEEFRHQLHMDRTIQEFSAPYTSEQNGLAEQMNQTLSTLANAMLEDSKLPKSFWTDAMSTATYVLQLHIVHPQHFLEESSIKSYSTRRLIQYCSNHVGV